MSAKSNRRMKWAASPSTIRLSRFNNRYRRLLLVFVSVIIVCILVYGFYSGATHRIYSAREMIWIAGGEFGMGSDEPTFCDAQPVHRMVVDGFWMDETEVTNAQFAKFVRAT